MLPTITAGLYLNQAGGHGQNAKKTSQHLAPNLKRPGTSNIEKVWNTVDRETEFGHRNLRVWNRSIEQRKVFTVIMWIIIVNNIV